MEGRDKPRKLDDFATVSRKISLEPGRRNFAKFSAENCGPYTSLTVSILGFKFLCLDNSDLQYHDRRLAKQHSTATHLTTLRIISSK